MGKPAAKAEPTIHTAAGKGVVEVGVVDIGGGVSIGIGVGTRPNGVCISTNNPVGPPKLVTTNCSVLVPLITKSVASDVPKVNQLPHVYPYGALAMPITFPFNKAVTSLSAVKLPDNDGLEPDSVNVVVYVKLS